MGEALITRRGGSVKTGMVADVQQFTMSDPALIGARNALIEVVSPYFGSEGYPASPTCCVVRIVIEDGVIGADTTFYLIEKSSRPCAVLANAGVFTTGYGEYPPVFDPTTGTITMGKHYDKYMASFYGYDRDRDTFAGEYRYYIWD